MKLAHERWDHTKTTVEFGKILFWKLTPFVEWPKGE